MKTNNTIRHQLHVAIAQMLSIPNISTAGMMEVQQLNSEYMGRASGKGRNTGPFIAMKSRHTNPKYPKPHQGAQECARRVAQGIN